MRCDFLPRKEAKRGNIALKQRGAEIGGCGFGGVAKLSLSRRGDRVARGPCMKVLLYNEPIMAN